MVMWGVNLVDMRVCMGAKTILDFSLGFDLTIANTCFRKGVEHPNTYKSGVACSQIDYFLIKKSDRKLLMDCRVISGENLTTPHKVLVMDVELRGE